MKTHKAVYPNMDEAERMALVALRFLAADMQYWSGFEAMSGIRPDMLGTLVGERGFLTGVLDYFLSDESLLLAFSSNASLAPQDIVNARHVLAGERSDFAAGF